MNVDERVYKLYLYLEDNIFNRDDVSEFLQITTRQLSRLLNKWQEEGILEYISGVGRGNASEVNFLVNVESHFINHLIHNIKSYDIQQLQEILKYPMCDSSRKLIKICIDESLFVIETIDYKEFYHMEYLYHIPKYLDPLMPNDLALITILNNVADKLYYIEGQGLKSKLVIYDEWIDNELIIHLYRNIRFSNGDILHAADVVDCLNKLLQQKNNVLPYQEVIEIEAIGSNKVKVKMHKRIESIRWALAKAEASIYKIIDNEFVFTGPYKVDVAEQDLLKLSFNEYFQHGVPDITSLMFVTDIKKYQQYYNEVSFKEIQSEEYYNNDFILFNPKTTLSNDDRGEIIRAINMILSGKTYGSKYKIEQSFKILLLTKSRDKNMDIVQRLDKKFPSLEIVHTDVTTYMENNLNTFDADLILMSEIVPNNQFYFELLTTGKFMDWYVDNEKSKELLHLYHHKPPEYWTYAEKRYENYMKNNNLIAILERYKKTLYFPDNFQNITTDSYGITFYNSIVVVDEEYNDD
ncbi:SgrR family transcriptional regulator [Macrococcoides canis]|uniref:SgrR family transcriptional regulator n=1 Tax=Macrococcoides canis TaxID=1855823 RepID=UPI0020B7E80A|nr:ABC transporter substrate-binding protein [Macrococcus canis]UTH00004.1 SgrR family transcriptional regulator [Macrococcus canis]